MVKVLDAMGSSDVELTLDIILQIKVSDSLKMIDTVLYFIKTYSEGEDAIFLLELSSQVCAQIIEENCKTNA